jgi:protease PrsW
VLIAVLGLMAIVPCLLLIWFFHARDVHPEPSRVVWGTFGLGILSIIPTLIVALPVSLLLTGIADPFMSGLAQAFLTAAMPEEAFKMAAVMVFAARHKAFDEPMDGVVYGVAAAMGFAALENVLYCAQGGIGVAVLRAVSALPMHAACGAIMGYFIGQATFVVPPGQRAITMFQAWMWPTLVHGLYDAPILAIQELIEASGTAQLPEAQAPTGGYLALAALGVLIGGVVWSLILTRRLRAEQLQLMSEGITSFVDEPEPAGRPLMARAVGGPPVTARMRVPQGSPVTAIVLMVLGGVLACVGGLVLIAVSLAFLLGEVSPDELGELLVGATIVGGAPTALGVLLFVAGVRKLPSAQRGASPYQTGRFVLED